MCLICIHLDENKMTPKEAFRALGELNPEQKHRIYVLQKIKNKINDNIRANKVYTDNGHSIICESEADPTLPLK